MRRALSILLAVATVWAPQACVGDDPNGATNGDTPDGSNDPVIDPQGSGHKSTLTLSASPFQVVRGASIELQVTLSWSGAAAPVPVSLAWGGLKPGMDGGTPVAVAPGTTTQTLTLSVLDSVALGDTTVQVIATSSDAGFQSSPIDVPLFVRGQPGTVDTTFGKNGEAVSPAENALAMSMGLEANDGFVITGVDTTSRELLLARYDASGQLDSSFARGGLARVQAPYPDTFPYSDIGHSPAGTEKTADGYRVGRAWMIPSEYGGTASYAATTYVTEAGTANTVPVAPPTETVGPGVTLAQGEEGIIHVSPLSRAWRQDASGARLSAWETAARPCPGTALCMLELLAASSDKLLVNASSTDYFAVATIDRVSGAVLASQTASSAFRAGVALPDGAFMALGPGRETVHFSAANIVTDLSPAPTIPSGSLTSLAALRNEHVGILVSAASGTVTFYEFGPVGVVGEPITMAAVSTGQNGSASQITRAYNSFEDARHRLVVMYFTRNREAGTSPHANPYWLIRRYWL